MQDNRWCSVCHKDRTQTTIDWYYCEELGELEFCTSCAKAAKRMKWFEGLKKMEV
jgi:hypothetical protein